MVTFGLAKGWPNTFSIRNHFLPSNIRTEDPSEVSADVQNQHNCKTLDGRKNHHNISIQNIIII